MSFLKNKRKYMYTTMAIVIILGSISTTLTANALISPNVGLETVGIDPDNKRTAFEDVIRDPDNNKSVTSVTIKTPDEVINNATYKADAIVNGTIASPKTQAEFLNAWKDGNVTYIDVEGDISTASITSTARPNGASPLIVQGNGHTVDLGGTNLKLAAITSDTIVTFNSINFKEDITVGTAPADSYSFLATANGTGTKLTVNMHNVSLSRSNATSTTKGPVHGVYATGARVVFSGNNSFDIAGGIVRSVGSVEIVDNASVTLVRNTSAYYTGAMRFGALPSGSVSKFNGLRIGNGATFDIDQPNATGAADTSSVDGTYGEVRTGDDVTWRQNNFGYFIRSNSTSGNWTFGQKNTIIIPKILNGNSLTIAYSKSVVFNAGTVLDFKQMLSNAYSPIQASAGTIRFISPKSLSMGIFAPNGNAKDGKLFYGLDAQGGKIFITNSTIQGWTGTKSSSSSPSFNTTFHTLEVRENGSRINGSAKTDANVFGNTTREFKIDGSGVGEVKINYIDQNGNKVGETDMPLVDGTNFVGQSFKLSTKEYAVDKMPKGYKWAIDEQVYTSAKTGDSGQPDGDTTNNADNGDSFGQANYAIVPMKGETYTYDVYVFSEGNPNITYTYVDPFSGLEIKSDKATVGSETARNYVPAHVGNTIDWTSKLYTELNVPTGYVYVPSSKLPSTVSQPTTSTVTDAVTPSNTFIYIYDPSYKGSLGLSTVPNINFGNHLISPENRGKEYPAKFSDDLIVNDDRRAIKDGWNLSVQQTTPLISADGKTVLKNSLFFRETDGGALAPLDSGSDLVIYDYTSQSTLGVLESVNLTSNWNKKTDGIGFYLKNNGKVTEGDYSTVLTWTLGAGPSF